VICITSSDGCLVQARVDSLRLDRCLIRYDLGLTKKGSLLRKRKIDQRWRREMSIEMTNRKLSQFQLSFQTYSKVAILITLLSYIDQIEETRARRVIQQHDATRNFVHNHVRNLVRR